MRPLYHCKACGFLSTRGDAFTRKAGVLLDNECYTAFERGDEPITQWTHDAIATEAQRAETA